MSLMGCGSSPIVRTEYVRQQIPSLPSHPEYYPVQWAKAGDDYCLDTADAKNLLKNKALQDAREKDLEIIIEGLR